MREEPATLSPALADRAATPHRPPLDWLFCIAFGCALTLCMRGYQFGQGNHNVYLLDAIRRISPQLLSNDWFCNATLHYHSIFGIMTEGLMRAGIEQPAFLALYLALVVLLHLGWWRLVKVLGGGPGMYLLSVVLYYLSAGGTGLGMYQFMQDGSLLPSNIANVALLWGLYWWIAGRIGAAGAAVGVAGLFHLNHAVLAVGLWPILLATQWRAMRSQPVAEARSLWIGSALAIGLSLVTLAPVFGAITASQGRLGLEEFVDLYVRLRHPHHYAPLTWPAALWISFLWPMPLLVVALRWRRATSWRRMGALVTILLAIQLLSLVFAGIWFKSEALIQMSLYRFSIYPKLLSCIAAAVVLCEFRWTRKRVFAGIAAAVLGLGALALMYGAKVVPLLIQYGSPLLTVMGVMVVALMWRRFSRAMPSARGALIHIGGAMAVALLIGLSWFHGLGFGVIFADDDSYIEMCEWIRDPKNTAMDAVFLVPPDEQAFRLHARRAIVVNFKGVPQLASELPIWRDRLLDVLQLEDLRQLPGPLPATLAAIRRQYESLSPEYLVKVAERQGADYIITTGRMERLESIKLRHQTDDGAYFLYELTQSLNNLHP
jgi:hypothetical protein